MDQRPELGYGAGAVCPGVMVGEHHGQIPTPPLPVYPPASMPASFCLNPVIPAYSSPKQPPATPAATPRSSALLPGSSSADYEGRFQQLNQLRILVRNGIGNLDFQSAVSFLWDHLCVAIPTPQFICLSPKLQYLTV